MAWIYLAVAGLFEVVWAVGLKSTQGFTRPGPSLLVGLAMLASMGLLSLAVRELPIGTAYAVWTGIGTLGAAVFGMLVLGEPAGALRLGAIACIAVGIAGLKLLPA
jgi:quaternary ammonium compound-resistance protein SugE